MPRAGGFWCAGGSLETGNRTVEIARKRMISVWACSIRLNFAWKRMAKNTAATRKRYMTRSEPRPTPRNSATVDV